MKTNKPETRKNVGGESMSNKETIKPQEHSQSVEALCYVPSWYPDNPYPKKLCKAQTLEDIKELLKDEDRELIQLVGILWVLVTK